MNFSKRKIKTALIRASRGASAQAAPAVKQDHSTMALSPMHPMVRLIDGNCNGIYCVKFLWAQYCKRRPKITEGPTKVRATSTASDTNSK